MGYHLILFEECSHLGTLPYTRLNKHFFGSFYIKILKLGLCLTYRVGSNVFFWANFFTLARKKGRGGGEPTNPYKGLL